MDERIALSPAEAAKAASISRSKLYQLMTRDDCDWAIKLDGRRLIHRAKFEAWLAKQTERN